MATITIDTDITDTVAELLEQLGGIPPQRVLMKPTPGTATVKDLIAALEASPKRICELIDGTLVEKAMGNPESSLTLTLGGLLKLYVKKHRLGMLLGPDGYLRLAPGMVRAPDISFISKERLPGEKTFPTRPVHSLAPDLAIEILSPGNTKREMTRKIAEYFKAGSQEVWLIQTKNQTAAIYSSPTIVRRIDRSGVLEGGTILPGFRLSMDELFEEMNT